MLGAGGMVYGAAYGASLGFTVGAPFALFAIAAGLPGIQSYALNAAVGILTCTTIGGGILGGTVGAGIGAGYTLDKVTEH